MASIIKSIVGVLLGPNTLSSLKHSVSIICKAKKKTLFNTANTKVHHGHNHRLVPITPILSLILNYLAAEPTLLIPKPVTGNVTKHCSQVVLLLQFQEVPGSMSSCRPAILNEALCVFPQSLQANAMIISEIRLLPPSNHYLLIIQHLTLYTLWSWQQYQMNHRQITTESQTVPLAPPHPWTAILILFTFVSLQTDSFIMWFHT
jgi:hypothetical protein